MSQRQAGDGSRHANREPGTARFFRIRISVLIEKDVLRGRFGGRFPIVDRNRAILTRQVYDHEAAAAQVPGAGQCHGECEANRDRRINRIAAAFENIDANLGGAGFLADHHPVRCHSGLSLRGSSAGIDFWGPLSKPSRRQHQPDEAARQSEREPNSTHSQVRPCP